MARSSWFREYDVTSSITGSLMSDQWCLYAWYFCKHQESCIIWTYTHKIDSWQKKGMKPSKIPALLQKMLSTQLTEKCTLFTKLEWSLLLSQKTYTESYSDTAQSHYSPSQPIFHISCNIILSYMTIIKQSLKIISTKFILVSPTQITFVRV